MTTLGVIPARGGSKGIPRKNLARVAGKPLLAWTCEAARASTRLTRVVLSTDDAEIAAVAGSYGVESPHPRPESLATDEAPILDVLLELLETLERTEQYRPDAIALLQPTSPLRTFAHIDGAIALLEESGADTVVTVVAVPHQYNPVSVMHVRGGRLVPFLPGPTVTRRQDKPEVFARNGPAVLVVRREVLQSGRLYGVDVRAFEMQPDESIDIDDPSDLEMAARLLERRARLTDSV